MSFINNIKSVIGLKNNSKNKLKFSVCLEQTLNIT